MAVLVVGGAVPAQAIEVVCAQPANGLTFGEPFEVTVVRSWSLGMEPEPFDEKVLAPLSVELASEHVESSSSSQGVPSTLVERRRYVAKAYVTGEVRLPPIEFRWRRGDAVETSTCTPAPFVVRSVLPEPPGDVEWLGDVREWPVERSRLWWLWVLAAAVGKGLWSRWRRSGATTRPTQAPGPAPHALALAQLAALPKPGGANAEIEAFYVQLTDIVRAYSEQRFAVRAAVCTSEELVRRVPLGAEPLQQCLFACDLVKFGARRPATEEHGAARQRAIAFVHATVPAGVAP
ncbi:MAG: hypothetical protein ABIP94_25130 [Planctomycetota bacterium]